MALQCVPILFIFWSFYYDICRCSRQRGRACIRRVRAAFGVLASFAFICAACVIAAADLVGSDLTKALTNLIQ